jgi:hypothetical protein
VRHVARCRVFSSKIHLRASESFWPNDSFSPMTVKDSKKKNGVVKSKKEGMRGARNRNVRKIERLWIVTKLMKSEHVSAIL